MAGIGVVEAGRLAAGEMRAWGLFDLGWSFAWNDRVRALGLCNYQTRTIYLSTHYVKVGCHDDVLDTIRHEIAHALAGCYAGHGPAWKAMCLRVGAKPERCKAIEGMPLGAWQATCGGCQKVYGKTRYTRRPGRISYCPKCGPTKGRLEFTKHTKDRDK